jgi:hypothetical protein
VRGYCLFPYVLAPLLAGCVSGQLTYNTVDVSDSVASLYNKQILSNLSQTIDDPFQIPSQVDLLEGTIQTAIAVTPTVSFPLSSQLVRTLTTSTTSTVANATTTAGVGGTLGASDTAQQNWNVIPISDANTLRNLRALYRYVIYGSDADLLKNYIPSRLIKGGRLVPDPYFLQLPQCVLCAKARKHEKEALSLFINPTLQPKWLYWSSDPGSATPERPPPPGVSVIDFGHYGPHELYITREDFNRGYFANFVLFALPNSEPPAAGSPSGAGAAKPGSVGPNGRATPPSGRNSYETSPQQANPGIQP